eukprot:1169235-Rhodomonas_salina.1
MVHLKARLEELCAREGGELRYLLRTSCGMSSTEVNYGATQGRYGSRVWYYAGAIRTRKHGTEIGYGATSPGAASGVRLVSPVLAQARSRSRDSPFPNKFSAFLRPCCPIPATPMAYYAHYAAHATGVA